MITGNNRNNTLNGGDGNDVIAGLGGTDILNGGNGDDRLRPGVGSGVADAINGGPGSNTVDYSDAGGKVFVRLGLPQDVAFSALGDVITGVENVIGSQFNDELSSAPGGQFHLAAGGGGNDIVFSTSETYDRVRGDAGFDRLVGKDGSADDFWLQYDLGMDLIYLFRTVNEDHPFISKSEFNLSTPAGSFINAAELQVGMFSFPVNNTVRLFFDTDTHILRADNNPRTLSVRCRLPCSKG